MLKRDGAVAAVRSLFIGADGMGWSGIDAPVPGIMAQASTSTRCLAKRSFVTESRGCQTVRRDIEASRPDRDGPAYRNYARLDFKIAYFRSHYSYLPANSG